MPLTLSPWPPAPGEDGKDQPQPPAQRHEDAEAAAGSGGDAADGRSGEDTVFHEQVKPPVASQGTIPRLPSVGTTAHPGPVPLPSAACSTCAARAVQTQCFCTNISAELHPSPTPAFAQLQPLALTGKRAQIGLKLPRLPSQRP